MTIQLTAPILEAGVEQAVGTQLTLGADREAELVNRGVAVYISRTLESGEGLVPALFDRTFTKLVKPDGTELSLGASSKFVSAIGAAVSCASGVSTPQGLSATGLLDTHSLVDTVNGTILIPSDATHMSVGLRSTPGWGAGGTYRQFDAEIEVVEGVWVSFGSKLTLSGLTSGPQTGPFLELQPTSVNAGKKMRFTAKQDSGGPLTPTNLGFYAQFMTL